MNQVRVQVAGKVRTIAAFAGAVLTVGALSGFAPATFDSLLDDSLVQDPSGSSVTLVSLDIDWEPGDTVAVKAQAPDPDEEDTADSAVGGVKCVGGGSWPDQVRAMITDRFGVGNIGGYRPGDPGDHGKGLALDVMVGGDSAVGDSVAQWALANKDSLNISYVIWQQQINMGGGWRGMEDRGSITQNHYDHVHISLNPGSGSCN